MGFAFKLQTIKPYPFGWIEVISSWCKGFVWVPVMIQMMWKNLLHQKEAWMKVGYFLCWVLQPWFLHRQETLIRCYLFWINTSLLLPSFTILSATHFPCLLKNIAWFQIDDEYLVWYLMYSITEALCSLEGVRFNSQPRNFIPSPKVLEPYLEVGKSYLFFINSNNSTKYPIAGILASLCNESETAAPPIIPNRRLVLNPPMLYHPWGAQVFSVTNDTHLGSSIVLFCHCDSH